jgi:tetratricopeptide (TPR) repeat protein
MINNRKFWIMMAVFQVVFGLSVFAITRQYYLYDSDSVSTDPTTTGQSSSVWPDQTENINSTLINSATFSQSTIGDPAEISRQADEFFANQQYDAAAGLYERLLTLGMNNADTYNNLGLTLHYVGRSTEALSRLNEGAAADPTYQRIWLTLGFVNSQLGNFEQARTALTTAVKLNSDNQVGRSSAKMLENLP